jgi:hypothetical protein
VGSGLGAVAFRYLIYFVTWLATGHVQFGQDGRVGSSHLLWLGLGFLPVMLAVAIATGVSRALSYGTIYTTELLRRGRDVDRVAPWRAFGDLKAADAMQPFPAPLPVAGQPAGDRISAARARVPLPGPVTYRRGR